MRQQPFLPDPSLRLLRVVVFGGLVILAQLLQGNAGSVPDLALAAAIVLAWWANTWRPHLVWLGLLTAASLSLEFLSSGRGTAAPVVGTVLALILLGRYPTIFGLPAAAVVLAGFDAIVWIRVPSTPAPALVFNLFGLGSAFGVSLAFRRLNEEKAHTQAALRELRAARESQLEAAKTNERARLAREIHDVLAHTLSALAVQLEGAKLIAGQQPGNSRLLPVIDRAHRLTRDGLVEVRRAVSALRGDALPGPDLLPDLARAFEDDSGIECRLEIEGDPVALKPDASLAVYRTAQEALTNVRKHADAEGVTLRLRYTGDSAELVVEDHGPPKPSLVASGYGLTGIRERAELLGGSLEAGPIENGFRVRLLVPA